MSSTRTQPLDLDALLLLQAGGELPPELEADLRQRLSEDPTLETRVAEMRATLDWVEQRFETADTIDGLRSDHAVRRAVDAIRDWQLAVPVAEAPQPRPLQVPQRRWGVASSAAAVVAIGLAVAALVTYLNPPRPVPLQVENLPSDDPTENPLALHAATSLAIGLDVDEDLQSSGMPPTSSEELVVTSDTPFFDVPLIADADE